MCSTDAEGTRRRRRRRERLCARLRVSCKYITRARARPPAARDDVWMCAAFYRFSVCNFVGVTKAGAYITPKSETILASTTNKMLQQLARDRGMIVEERQVDYETELSTFAEVGMCGTAAVHSPASPTFRDGSAKSVLKLIKSA